MARKTFFSFQFAPDVSRAFVVRNSAITKKDVESAGFIDKAEFEEVQKKGDAGIKKWIDDQLLSTTVTVVLIGSTTTESEYVIYELQRSYARGNAIIGIYVHNIKDLDSKTATKGSNHFGEIGKDSSGKPVYLSTGYKMYDWVNDDGYNNLGTWIEDAAKAAGK